MTPGGSGARSVAKVGGGVGAEGDEQRVQPAAAAPHGGHGRVGRDQQVSGGGNLAFAAGQHGGVQPEQDGAGDEVVFGPVGAYRFLAGAEHRELRPA